MRTMTLAIVLILGAAAAAAADEARIHYSNGAAIEEAGLHARIDASVRDEVVQRLAATIAHWAEADRAVLKELQRPLQEALLLQCDRGVYETLAPETIAAVDDALESIVSFDEIHRSNDWEPLIYVYGFFNRDVTAAEIAKIGGQWLAMSSAEREPIYPTYVHAIDAVCKPLSMGPLTNGETIPALEAALPVLTACLTQPPAPGRAFHPPSHAALVLAALYDQWAAGTAEGDLLRRELGERDAFVATMTEQMVGSRADRMELPEFMYGFYATSGMYIANALARMGARDAVPVLRTSLDVYTATGARASSIAYTERALLALGDVEMRQKAEANPDEATMVWLCRNGDDETAAYASERLARLLDCRPEEALTRYFERERAAVGK